MAFFDLFSFKVSLSPPKRWADRWKVIIKTIPKIKAIKSFTHQFRPIFIIMFNNVMKEVPLCQEKKQWGMELSAYYPEVLVRK